MKYKLKRLRDMIPLYLNGTLGKEEKKILENSLEEFPQLKREFDEFSEIKNSYKGVKNESISASNNIYKKILEKIEERKLLNPRKGHLENIKSFISSPIFSWGFAVFELIVIVLLFFYLPREAEYKTFSTEHFFRGGEKINVVFESESKEKEIRELLIKIEANIVSGPTSEGLYMIEIKKGGDLESAIKYLKKSGIVKFAEKAY